jgi:hypothetical protein
MKRIIIFLMLVVCFVGTARADLAAWLLADNEVVGARIGYVKDNVEVGGLSYWWYGDQPPAPPQVFGAYGIYHFPDVVEVNNPLPVSWLPKTLKASPYLGMQIGVSTKAEKRDYIGPIVGVRFHNLVAEYQWRNYSDALATQLGSSEHVLMAGIRIQF